jgi:hypothetical protein
MEPVSCRSRWGAAAVLATLCFLLSTAALGQSSTYRPAFALDPSGGSTYPGGQARFTINGINRSTYVYQVTPVLAQGPAGVSLSVQPPTFTLGKNTLASAKATLLVATGVPPGTYPIRIRLNLTRSLGGASEAVAPLYQTFSLRVKSAGL